MKYSFREGTNDSLIFEEVFSFNAYSLPECFSKEDIVIDIGAHVGFFSLAVLQRGAGRIYAFEPDLDNYRLATSHLHEAISQQTLVLSRSAVWRSDLALSSLLHSGYSSDDAYINTGTGSVLGTVQGTVVPTVAFDQIVWQATQQGQRRIRLLKLDCEGAEWPILFTASTLHLIDVISGEFHELGGDYDARMPPFALGNYTTWTIERLIVYLALHGFSTSFTRGKKADGSFHDGGIFIASRNNTSESV